MNERVVVFSSPPGWSVVHKTDSLDLLSTLGDRSPGCSRRVVVSALLPERIAKIMLASKFRKTLLHGYAIFLFRPVLFVLIVVRTVIDGRNLRG